MTTAATRSPGRDQRVPAPYCRRTCSSSGSAASPRSGNNAEAAYRPNMRSFHSAIARGRGAAGILTKAVSLFSSDLALARRLELAEAANTHRFASGTPGAEVLDIMGGSAVFAGVGGFATQAIGCGMSGPVTEEELDRMEEFYLTRGSPVNLNVSPMADLSLWELVMRRGYTIREIENVVARRLDGPVEPHPAARRIEPGTEAEWARMVAQGFSGLDEPPPVFAEALGPSAFVSQCFACYESGRMVSGGAMNVESGVALLYGDATLLPYRGRGLQSAIIQTRLSRAAAEGCEYAMATVNAGSGSHRNYERAGFRVMYTRVNVKRESPGRCGTLI